MTPAAVTTPGTPGSSRRRPLAPVIVLVIAVVMAGLFWILIGADTAKPETGESPLLGRPAPAVTAERLGDSEPFNLQRRKGSWVVLNFFNSTCAPCKQEHPELVEFAAAQEAKGADGAELYTVMWGQDRVDDVTGFFRDNGGDWPILTDDDASIAVAFGVAKVPETWIIDPDGVVQWRIISNTSSDKIEELIARSKATA
jgi:cytochrome c biogenesis protein CcmG/thiol:disulfide interchange protein DsbE